MKYGYPDEDSKSVLRGVKCLLTTENYHSKYHRLVYLDDLEHTRKMIQEYAYYAYIYCPMRSVCMQCVNTKQWDLSVCLSDITQQN